MPQLSENGGIKQKVLWARFRLWYLLTVGLAKILELSQRGGRTAAPAIHLSVVRSNALESHREKRGYFQMSKKVLRGSQ